MSEPTNEQIPHFAPDILLTVELNASAISGIQCAYSYLLQGKTREDADALNQKLRDKSPLEPWDYSVVTLTNLMNTILTTAKSSNQVVYKSLDDTLQELSATAT